MLKEKLTNRAVPCIDSIRAIYTRKNKTRLMKDVNFQYKRHISSKIRRVLAKSRLILDEMCRLYGKFTSYIRRVLIFLV